MKIRLHILGIVMAMMIVFTGCGMNPTKETANKDEQTVADDNAADKTSTDNQNEEKPSEDQEQDPEKVESLSIHVIAPNGTPTLSMIKMFEENPSMGEEVHVTYESIAATDVLTSKLMQEEADIAIVPTNLAANLYNNKLPYKYAGSSVWGVLYLVSNEDITGIEDLKGKEISMIGRGLTPDATFRYVLTQHNMTPDVDITLNYFSGSSELASSFISGKGNYALIPEPLLTKVLMKRKDAKVILDLQEAWQTTTGISSYPQASIIIHDDLILNHPEVVDTFLSTYEKAIDWNNENPLKAGEYYENLGIGLNAQIINKAMAGCNIRFVGTADAKAALDEYLKVLHEFNPKLLGGKFPDEDFYLEK